MQFGIEQDERRSGTQHAHEMPRVEASECVRIRAVRQIRWWQMGKVRSSAALRFVLGEPSPRVVDGIDGLRAGAIGGSSRSVRAGSRERMPHTKGAKRPTCNERERKQSARRPAMPSFEPAHARKLATFSS